MSPKEFVKETRTVGFRTALEHFYHRRHLPLLGYLLLAGAITWTIADLNRTQNASRNDLRDASVNVVITSCERDNDTREILRSLIRAGIPQTRQYVKEGVLTQAQADRSIRSSRAAIRVLKDTDCKKYGSEFRSDSFGE